MMVLTGKVTEKVYKIKAKATASYPGYKEFNTNAIQETFAMLCCKHANLIGRNATAYPLIDDNRALRPWKVKFLSTFNLLACFRKKIASSSMA